MLEDRVIYLLKYNTEGHVLSHSRQRGTLKTLSYKRESLLGFRKGSRVEDVTARSLFVHNAGREHAVPCNEACTDLPRRPGP